ncbi:MAG: hypothetical protein IKJ80_05190 [Clostridia bacterium]|nr:hypothetical protein [Clostridia bacterium]
MKKLLTFALAALMLVLPSCNGEAEQTTAPTTPETTPAVTTPAETTAEETTALRDKETELRILFIGNSFTFYNDMPTKYFRNLCGAAGYKVKVEAITNGGHFLSEFADTSDEYGAKVDKALKNNKYDIVILQEQSGCPIANRSRFFGGVRDLAKKVKDNGAELYLYETWGYKKGYSKLSSHGGTTKIMEMKLRAAYTAIAEEVGAQVILAGVAMLDIHTQGKIEVYRDDLFHPSAKGSALVAYTIFAKIFMHDPRTVKYTCGMGEEISADMKEAAYKAVFEEQPIPDGYKVKTK